jgi:hypothetical protein
MRVEGLKFRGLRRFNTVGFIPHGWKQNYDAVCTRPMHTPVPTTRDKHHRFPAEMISQAVWLDFRFCLSDRDGEALLVARGLKFVLLAALLYTPGTVLYFWARREQNTRVFKPAEVVIFLVAVVGALVCVYWLATGYITR